MKKTLTWFFMKEEDREKSREKVRPCGPPAAILPKQQHRSPPKLKYIPSHLRPPILWFLPILSSLPPNLLLHPLLFTNPASQTHKSPLDDAIILFLSHTHPSLLVIVPFPQLSCMITAARAAGGKNLFWKNQIPQ